MCSEGPDDADSDVGVSGDAAEGGVEGPPVVNRQDEEEDAGEGDEPVVVEVQGGVDEFGVGEPDEEQTGCEAVPVAGGDAQSERSQGGDVEVHERGGQGLDPVEPAVGEVVFGVQVQGVDPSLGQESDGAVGDEEPVADAEDRDRVGGHRSTRTVEDPVPGPVWAGFSCRCRRLHR